MGAIVLLLMFLILKPNIEIADNIAYNSNTETYHLKIVNKSHFFSTNEVSVELFKISFRNLRKGKNVRLDKINFSGRDSVRMIPGKLHHTPNADYAHVFSTKCDLRRIMETNESHIKFIVSARHSLTGFTKVYEQEYFNYHNIQDGVFCYGDTFEIEPVVP